MQRISVFSFLLMLLAACTRTSVTPPDFTVTLQHTSLRAGDTAVFVLNGNPDIISFYAGDSTHEYQYRNRFTADGTPQLQFTSTMQTGSQDSTLHVLISTDFAAQYDSAGIYQAHWTDITGQTILSAGGSKTPSGIINLGDFVNGGEPVYLAFKYEGFQDASAQRTWTIPTLGIINQLKEGTQMPVAATLADAGFTAVDMKGTGVKWSISSTQLQIKGGAANSDATENWVVSKPLTLNRAVPDKGLPVKNISANRVRTYSYIYKTAGTFTATFDVSNTTVYDSKGGTKEVKVTVNP
ncbi:DUF5017 domain-containing protein [Chitinophaga agrisoli]|nr:DUF5017 domain-containing protein [Chitinophaga agrisoli]